MQRGFLEKMVVYQAIEKFPTVKGTRMFITLIAEIHHRPPILQNLDPVHTFSPDEYKIQVKSVF